MQNYHNVLSNEAHEQSHPRKGSFTLTEMLVCTAIGAILVALLAPAVQQARVAAQRTQMKNDMKNLGLAVHNFEQAHGHLPSAFEYDANTKMPIPWTVQLLPYLDQAPLYNTYDRTKGPNEQASEILEAKVEVLSRWDRGGDFSPGTVPGNRQPNGVSMMMVAGDGVFNGNLPPTDPPHINRQGMFFPRNSKEGFNGMITPGKAQRIRDVTDGMSNTIMAVESSGPNTVHDRPYFNLGDLTVNGAHQGGVTIHKSLLEDSPSTVYGPPAGGGSQNTPIDRSHERWAGRNWTTLLRTGKSSPNLAVRLYEGTSERYEGDVQVLLGDGSVRTIRRIDGVANDSDQANLGLIRALVTRSGGEVVPEF